MNRRRHGPRICIQRPNAGVGVQDSRSLWLPSAAQRRVGPVGPRGSTYSWDPNDGLISPSPEPVGAPRLTVRREHPDIPLALIEATFSLSPSYGIRTAEDARGWFWRMMREHEEFDVETDRAGEPPLSFCSETVRRVVVE